MGQFALNFISSLLREEKEIAKKCYAPEQLENVVLDGLKHAKTSEMARVSDTYDVYDVQDVAYLYKIFVSCAYFDNAIKDAEAIIKILEIFERN